MGLQTRFYQVLAFSTHESDLPGHVYNAIQTAEEFGHTHILEEVADFVRESEYKEHMAKQEFSSEERENAKYVFNEALKSSYDPTLLPKLIETRMAALQFAEEQFAKVMNAKSNVNIDFSLAAEPLRWEETLPEVCSESERWREAMDDEIWSMTKFGVYKKLPKKCYRKQTNSWLSLGVQAENE